MAAQLFLADPVGFFRSGCSAGYPAWLITQSTSDWLILFSRAPPRHARLKASQTEPPGVCFPAPRFACFSRNGLAPKSSTCFAVLSGADISRGLSLTSRNVLFPGCREKVNAPGYSLQCRADLSIEPVPLTAPPLSPVCPVLGRIIAMSPLPDFAPALLAATVSPLPSRDFYIPLRIAAFDAACRSKAHLLKLPDFLSLPAGRSLLTISLRITVPGSLLLTRFDCSCFRSSKPQLPLAEQSVFSGLVIRRVTPAN